MDLRSVQTAHFLPAFAAAETVSEKCLQVLFMQLEYTIFVDERKTADCNVEVKYEK